MQFLLISDLVIPTALTKTSLECIYFIKIQDTFQVDGIALTVSLFQNKTFAYIKNKKIFRYFFII